MIFAIFAILKFAASFFKISYIFSRHLVVFRTREIQRNFLEILEKRDNHLSEIEKFEENYNHFLEENPSMIKEKSAKDYITGHLNTLYESLWTSIEIRKNTAIEERKSIVHSGWIEEEMEKILMNFQLIMQIEINKLLESLLIIQNFYSVFEQRTMGDCIEHLIIDPFENEIPKLENEENQDNFPKIQKIFEKTFELIEEAVPHVLKSEEF